MPTIIDITNVGDMDLLEIDGTIAIRPRKRRPLNHRALAWQFNDFTKSNNSNSQTKSNAMSVATGAVHPQRQLSIKQLQSFQQQQLCNDLNINSHSALSTYPISVSVIKTDDYTDKFKNDMDTHQETEANCCKKFCSKFFKAIDEYCDSSTLHGLKYVGDNSLGNVERFFWFVAFVAAVSCSAYFIASLYDKFNTSPMVTSFNPKMVFLKEIPFPAVTICNVNLVLKSKADQILNSGSKTEKKLLKYLCNAQSGEIEESFGNDDTTNWTVVKEFIIRVNQNCDALVKVCKWNGRMYDDCDELINSVLTDEGYCCSFNRLPENLSLRDNITNQTGSYPEHLLNWNPEDGYGDLPMTYYPYRSDGPGQRLGLSLLLDAQLDEYYCTSTNSIGFKILFSNPTELPKIAEVGFLLAPGDETRITIVPDVKDATDAVRGIHVDKRQCFFARERALKFYLIYSEKNCRLECEANYTLEQCGCVPYYLPRLEVTKICNKEKENCTYYARDTIERFSPQRLACRCLPTCNEVLYKPDTLSFGKIVAKYNVTASREILQNFSYDYFSENMAIAHFYFGIDKYPKQTRSVLYGFSEFLSNTGGLLGLFMGFSFLSAVEIIYFIFFRGPCRLYRQQKLQEKQKRMQRWATLPYLK